ncbi:MAG: alpha-N-arabinofuranosidase [Colwellia sp.]
MQILSKHFNIKKFSQTLLLSTSLSLCLTPLVFANEEVSLTISTNDTLGTINKNVYGQFAEHLGRGIYEGIWVGKDSNIKNVDGFRTDVIDALKALKVPLIRWPGGCFADEYHWRDGIGDKRTVKINTTWGGVEEPNTFGTHEFFQLAEILGSDTYVNGNLGTGTPQEMAEWLEYMTADNQSALAKLRRKNGRDEPWQVDFFAIGNEAWGCGGHMRPEYYADLYRHYSTFAKSLSGKKMQYIASGGNGNDTTWTEVLSKNVKQKIDAIAHHYYTLPTGKWSKKGTDVNFPETEWMSTLVNTLKIEKFITDNVAVLDKNDPEKKIGFYVDEWGTWYDNTPGNNPGFLYQQNTIRDAIVAALNFNVFHQYPQRVKMTNIAQMVNVLQAMILTDKEKMLLTPTYYAYKMYRPFQDAQALKLTTTKQTYYQLGEDKLPMVSASAATGADGKLYLSLVNVDPNKSVDVQVTFDDKSKKYRKAIGSLLSADKIDQHNTFDKPEQVKPIDYAEKSKNGLFTFTIPAKSIVVVEIKE